MLLGRPLPIDCPLPAAALIYKSHYATSARHYATFDSHYASNTQDYAQNTFSRSSKDVFAGATPKIRLCYGFWQRIKRRSPVGL